MPCHIFGWWSVLPSLHCQDLCLQYSAFCWLQLILLLCKAARRVPLTLWSSDINPEKSTKGMGGGKTDTGRYKEQWVLWRLHFTSKPYESSHPLMQKLAPSLWLSYKCICYTANGQPGLILSISSVTRQMSQTVQKNLPKPNQNQ